jgi:adenylate cyclase
LFQNLEVSGEAQMATAELKYLRSIVGISVVAAVLMTVWAIIVSISGWWWFGLQNITVGLAFLIPIKLVFQGRKTLAAITILVVFFTQMSVGTYAFGFASGSWIYFTISIVVPFMIFGQKDWGWRYSIAGLSVIGLLASIAMQDYLPLRYEIFEPKLIMMTNAFLACMGLTIFAYLFLRAVERGEGALAEAHRRANDLLLNAIPEVVAERLKDNPDKLIADRHEDVSIMFVDVAGFTAMSAQQDPAETVNMLNTLFSEFDEVCKAKGIEKIRTIGDGYMVVGGAPQALEDHTSKMIEAARQFLDVARRCNIDIRIGINAGEVVAGIVGTTRFHYDVWGDAVNLAARLETTGKIGRIHVSDEFANRLANRSCLEKREPIEIKGKGLMQTWFIDPEIS